MGPHDPSTGAIVGPTVADPVSIRDGRTSSEVLRRTEVTEDGQEQVIAQEYAVLGRAGRVQIPRDFVTTLELRDRVRLALESDHVGVWGDRPQQEEEQ